jgi:hypothetical protein
VSDPASIHFCINARENCGKSFDATTSTLSPEDSEGTTAE